ncbi:MAG TPA: diguanylate cyclase [Lachnoclostridium sp.]|uniref:sensor domain-containing diguanylate cyclase n=2 Tax=Lacrimispora sp. TaxID=2719234 RepID=UPI000EE5ABC5|nr:sensor domain-containing diguanylate cyclase [Lacrimispora sp.]HCD45651.1 diguanylate cyclase [Lachnoclostridium sp.]
MICKNIHSKKEECVIRRKYTIFLSTIICIICTVMVCFYLFSIDKVGDIYIEKSEEAIYNIKKDFLKDTVNNLISEIELRRAAKSSYVETFVSRTSDIINMKKDLPDSGFNDFFIRFFRDNPDYKSMIVVLWDNQANKAIYDPGNLAGDTWKDTLKANTSGLSSYRVFFHGDYAYLFGLTKSYVNELVKSDIANVIRNSKFDGNSYIWVNEIQNYQGGKNYAIRRIHPNLPDTEGIYLSTDMTDIAGNYPYLTELQGINKDGELYFSYYFKEPGSDKVSKKLAYAKLYKDYDWVVAMGVYLDDLQPYVDQTSKESKELVSRITLLLVLLLIVILIVSLFSISLLEKIYYRHAKKAMESELNQDVLTKAGNRRSGTNDLTNAFKEYKRTGLSPGIMMCDVDHFKGINDQYGHFAGDMALAEFVNVMKSTLRSTDKIIRWGGDEFVVILNGIEEKHVLDFGSKFLTSVSSLKILEHHEEIGITVSVGFSFFKEGDEDFHGALRRADEALYKSKSEGRNQANVIL